MLCAVCCTVLYCTALVHRVIQKQRRHEGLIHLQTLQSVHVADFLYYYFFSNKSVATHDVVMLLRTMLDWLLKGFKTDEARTVRNSPVFILRDKGRLEMTCRSFFFRKKIKIKITTEKMKEFLVAMVMMVAILSGT